MALRIRCSIQNTIDDVLRLVDGSIKCFFYPVGYLIEQFFSAWYFIPARFHRAIGFDGDLAKDVLVGEDEGTAHNEQRRERKELHGSRMAII